MVTNERRHKFYMDWSLNIGNVLSIVIFLLAGIGAWYDVKTDVKLNHNEAQLKFSVVEAFMIEQKANNISSETQRDKMITEVRSSIKEDTRDIKQEIRDLRSDILTHDAKKK